uniref:Sphingoid long-chain bases kinase 1 n=2 Tax=Anthurium amnicola TaxID=1678845 RepID=A0A1D1YE79_9ARAE
MGIVIIWILIHGGGYKYIYTYPPANKSEYSVIRFFSLPFPFLLPVAVGGVPVSCCFPTTHPPLALRRRSSTPRVSGAPRGRRSAAPFLAAIGAGGCASIGLASPSEMQKASHLSRKISSLRVFSQQPLRNLSSKHSQTAAVQHSSPNAFPEKQEQVKSSRQSEAHISNGDQVKAKTHEHRIDIGDEKSDLLGYEVFSGKLSLLRRPTNPDIENGSAGQDGVDARLTSKGLFWGSNVLSLLDIISVSYCSGLRHFTVHAYPVRKRSCGLSCFLKPQRSQKDFRFLASTLEEARSWVTCFADQQCYVNLLPHPMVTSKKQGSDEVVNDPFFEYHIKSKSPPKVLVILNPRSGHGRSSKVFHDKVEPIFKLAGFKMEVVNTTSAGHAKTLASTVDFSACPDGIICVGGDGIINEVLNGLLGRNNQKEAISIPIGIIPTGSDNSLVWTILGLRDPICAAMNIVKGGLTPTDVFAVEWIQTGIIHFGSTVSYFGFLSDVLELSEKYQKRFGPLRYFVAGFLKFLCLPKYSYELEYLPASEASNQGENNLAEEDRVDISDLYPDIMRRSHKEGLPRASSLSSIDSIMTPSRMSGDLEMTGSTLASHEPSDYVRGLDPKTKRLSLGRSNITPEPEEVLHPQHSLSATPNWPRTRSKSRTDKGWAALTTTNDARCSWGAATLNDKEDNSSTLSDPGPVWDSEPKWDAGPKWDTEANWESENPIELPGLADNVESETKKEIVPKYEEKWVVKKGHFLGILVCNHSCKTVQSLSSQVVAPKAEHDDNCLDLLLVHGSGRLRLLRFFLRLQCGRHLSLPYVEYVKVKSVKVKPGKTCHNGCGIDGELLRVNGEVICSLLPDQCRLIGRPAQDCV